MSARTKARTGEGKVVKAQGVATVRASISFPQAVYETLEAIAQEKKVSLAWVVRDATEKYLSDTWPMRAKQKGD